MPLSRIPVTGLLAFLTLSGAPAAGAGPGPVEIGVDLGLEVLDVVHETQTSDQRDGSWEISLPGGGAFGSYQTGFRVAVPTSRTLAIEPAVGFNYQRSGGVSFYNMRLLTALIADFPGKAGEPREYVKGGAGVRILGGGGDSDAQFLLGGGIGVRSPIGERMASRIELTYMRAFESEDIGGVNVFDVRLGLSFFVGGAPK